MNESHSKSIFDEFDRLIVQALKVNTQRHKSYVSACREVVSSEVPTFLNPSLVSTLFKQMERNWNNGDLSNERTHRNLPTNWCLRTRRPIGHTAKNGRENISGETILERAIVRLSDEGKLEEEWYNQIPTASGLVGSDAGKSCNVDLVRFEDGVAEFVELKWRNVAQDPNSNNHAPLAALFQVLHYGLVFLFSRLNSKLMDQYWDRPLIKAKKLRLSVLSTPLFYRSSNCQPYAMSLARGLNALHDEHANLPEMSCRFLQFPVEFKFPFESGSELDNMFASEHDRSRDEIIEQMNSMKTLWEVPPH